MKGCFSCARIRCDHKYLLEESNLNLRLPGPIPVPDDVLASMARPMINHRGPEFKEILYRVTERLKQVFDTAGDVYILTASGTGAMEAAVVNTLSRGDKVICVSIGSFGDRFGEIAEIFGADVVNLTFEPGTAADPDVIRKAILSNSDTKAVLVTHNETSTGVVNDLEAISVLVKEEFGLLLLVDGISSVCSLPLRTDAWGCDVVATASQKGWMLPPGLAFISFSEMAWQAHSTSSMPKFYFDVAQYRKYYEIGQPPYTPGISTMFALDLALDRIINEGMDSVYKRHAEIGRLTREGVRKLGLSVFPDEANASDTVTAVRVPDRVDASVLLSIVQDEHGVVLASGQEALKDKIIRIGHMGDTSVGDIQGVLDALDAALRKLGFETASI